MRRPAFCVCVLAATAACIQAGGTARPAEVHGAGRVAFDLAGPAGAALEVDGLVGLNFLRSFRVTLDFERQVLALE